MAEWTTRNLSDADVPAMQEIASHWSVVRQLGSWPWPPVEEFTRSRCQPYPEEHGFVWGICVEGRLVGSIGATRGILGYMFHPDVHGQGVATRFGRMAVQTAFETYDWSMMRAAAWADNAASQRVLEKLGFEKWRTSIDHSVARRVPSQGFDFRLTRARWLAL